MSIQHRLTGHQWLPSYNGTSSPPRWFCGRCWKWTAANRHKPRRYRAHLESAEDSSDGQ